MGPARIARRRAATLTEAPHRAGLRIVVSYSGDDAYNPRSHECVTRMKLASRLAALKGCGFGGEFDRSVAYACEVYYVPSRTIVGCDAAAALGIRGAHDLFGGVVPHAFVSTKSITHPLIDADARAPHGWSHAFSQAVSDAVLEGYSAFSGDDAMRAGARLLQSGAIRVKPALALGGRGQTVVETQAALHEALKRIDPDELEECDVVLERNLADVETYSVGRVEVGDLQASYVGTQSLTVDNRGLEVYGGSDLLVARGGFDALLALDISPAMKRAAERAQVYDAAAHACFPGFFASRRNYDVVEGRDAQGHPRTGVLEQSWRAGGASGAEIAALEWFGSRPRSRAVRAWCAEVYGADAVAPDGAVVYFSGVDDEVGYITKYTMLDPYADA
jgi:hypothetical protein